MNKRILLALLGIHFCAFSAGRGTSIDVTVDADMPAKIVIYYKGVDVTSGEINFPLYVDAGTRKYINTSDYIYLVGNVSQAKIIMESSPFELTSKDAPDIKMPLNGYFTMNASQTRAENERIVPVLAQLSQGSKDNGLKVTFESKERADNYGAGGYIGQFTMIVTPIL
ncbi:hypothetical protein [Leminorella grimontii]|nr:hypothetical protein [Leminorella grimontii]VFS61532.1 Uncharacterised protein [Leminorella grimontii]